jgi:hypothetical protein
MPHRKGRCRGAEMFSSSTSSVSSKGQPFDRVRRVVEPHSEVICEIDGGGRGTPLLVPVLQSRQRVPKCCDPLGGVLRHLLHDGELLESLQRSKNGDLIRTADQHDGRLEKREFEASLRVLDQRGHLLRDVRIALAEATQVAR